MAFAHTRICHGDRGRVLVADQTAQRWCNDKRQRRAGGDDARPEVGRALAGSPAEVADGTGVETGDGGRHAGQRGCVVVVVKRSRR